MAGRDRQPRWPKGTPVAAGGKGPGGGRFRGDGKPNKPSVKPWEAEVSDQIASKRGGAKAAPAKAGTPAKKATPRKATPAKKTTASPLGSKAAPPPAKKTTPPAKKTAPAKAAKKAAAPARLTRSDINLLHQMVARPEGAEMHFPSSDLRGMDQLRRLEKAGLVRRVGRGSRWGATDAGIERSTEEVAARSRARGGGASLPSPAGWAERVDTAISSRRRRTPQQLSTAGELEQLILGLGRGASGGEIDRRVDQYAGHLDAPALRQLRGQGVSTAYRGTVLGAIDRAIERREGRSGRVPGLLSQAQRAIDDRELSQEGRIAAVAAQLRSMNREQLRQLRGELAHQPISVARSIVQAAITRRLRMQGD